MRWSIRIQPVVGAFKMIRGALLLSILLAPLFCYGDTGPGASEPSVGTRERIGFVAASLVGTLEATGRNDGPVVEAILASTGNRRGDPWCGSANRYIYDLSGFRQAGPRSAWSPDWVRSPTWTAKTGGLTPLPGDAFGIWFPSKGRIAHTGLVKAWGTIVLTWEGNTSPDAAPGSPADRDGGGYWSKRRLKKQIHSVRDWIK